MMKKIVAITASLFLSIVAFGLLPITVLADSPSTWASEEVSSAISLGLVPQELQSHYTQPITRAEFGSLVVMLYEAMTGEATEFGRFSDGQNLDANLTREQAATILTRIADAVGNPLPLVMPTASDSDEFSAWAWESIGQVQAAGIMGSTSAVENVFSPSGVFTREQSMVTLYRLYAYLRPTIVRVDLRFLNITCSQLARMVESGEIPVNVTHLDLAGNYIVDISPLGALTELIELNLWGNRVEDVSPLKNLTNLEVLIFWGNRVVDITPLAGLTNLVRFSLGDNLYFNGDLSVLANFTNLTHLGLGDTRLNRMSDFSSIAYLTNLESLQLWGASELRDISILSNLTYLSELTIHAANVQDYSPLGNLSNLTSLDLQQNRISDIPSLHIDGLTNLTSLSLWHNQIRDISSLRGLTSLTHLALSGNEISNVEPLRGLTNLVFLSLGNNQITDVSPLRGLYNLQQIDLSGNPIASDGWDILQYVQPIRTITIGAEGGEYTFSLDS